MKRALISGASGFVGANLARRLLHEGYQVHCLLRPKHKPWRIREILDELTVHPVDLSDAEKLKTVVRSARPDYVFHLAAHGAYSYQDEFRQIADTNIFGTVNLLDACLKTGFDVFLNAGSSSEYGFQDHAPTEDELPLPNSTYSWSKLSAAFWCSMQARLHSQRIHTLRLYSVYGPWEEPTRLVPTLIKKGMDGQLPPLVNPDIARDYIYTEDVENAFLSVATTDGLPNDAIYNVCTGTETKLRDIVSVTRELLSIDQEPEWGSMPQRNWDTNKWVGKPDQLTRATQWRPRFKLEDGLKKTCQWLSNPSNLKYYE